MLKIRDDVDLKEVEEIEIVVGLSCILLMNYTI
mgnify:CR=1 FL=1|uniref:Uncharacterized protein n=2 Tax=unclassified Caudoviricetes TaxID=2788787 RepID=A0A8S5NMG4_9CAUD|nr:MAG TPA: hypothetical protein [Myoviridae sp. ctSGm32]DAD98990.1 MAG TPA: hypothetical protein [Myoviridae sp. ctjs85]